MAKALVLGATGHIGAHIVRALLAEGHRVRVSYRNPKFIFVLDGLEVEKFQVDLDRPEELTPALDGCEWVFHAAGFYPGFTSKKKPAIEQAIHSTKSVLSQIKRAKPSRVVFTSSAATIRRVAGRASCESDFEDWPPEKWRNLYSSVKIVMEHEALKFLDEGLPIVVANPSLCIGEYDAHCFSGKSVLAFAKYKIPAYFESSFNAIYTKDVGIGHVRMASMGRIGQRYLLANENISLRDFSLRVCRIANVRPPFIRLPYHVVLMLAYASEALAWITRKGPLLPHQAVQSSKTRQLLDSSKARNELQLPQTPVDEAIRKALEWFSKNGYLN